MCYIAKKTMKVAVYAMALNSYVVCRPLLPRVSQRELKLDGAIGQEEICNFLKSEKFSNIGKKRENVRKNNFLAIMKR